MSNNEKKLRETCNKQSNTIEQLMIQLNLQNVRIEKLSTDLSSLRADNDSNLKLINTMSFLIKTYEDQLGIAKSKRYGASSEKSTNLTDVEKNIDNTVAEAKNIVIQNHDKKPKGRKTGGKNLANINAQTVIIDKYVVSSECDCNADFDDLGYETSKKVIITPAKVYIEETRIHKIICKKCNKITKAHHQPEFPGSSLSSSLAAELVVAKYFLHLPLNRQAAFYKSVGLNLKRQNLANYINYTYNLLRPLHNLLKESVLNTDRKLIMTDETTYKVISGLDTDTRKKCYIWLYASSLNDKMTYYYEFCMNRRKEHPVEFFKSYEGSIICDAYGGYMNLDSDDIYEDDEDNKIPEEISKRINVACCYSHARRKLTDLTKGVKEHATKGSVVYQALVILQKAFYEESKLVNMTASERQVERKNKVEPIINEYFSYIKDNNPNDRSSVGKAFNYSLNQEDMLRKFLEDGNIPMTNNESERSLRSVVLGRRNYMHSFSVDGANASAFFYSLIETAKANLVRVQDYIEYIIKVIPDTKTSELVNLLPTNQNMIDKFL